MTTFPDKRSERGHLIVVLMVFVAIMMIGLLAAAQSWSFLVRRDAEAELLFRAQEYAEAIEFYYSENKSYPLDLNVLIEEGGPHRHRYIRHLYEDPIAEDGKWGLLYLSPSGQGFINPWGSPGAAGQLFAAEEFGFDPAKDRSGTPRGNTRESTGLPAGHTDLVEKQMEQFRGDVTGMPIVGVVHKKKEDGIKLYDNIASINDWAIVAKSIEEGMATGVGGGARGRGAMLGGKPTNVVGDSQHPITLGGNPRSRPKNQYQEELREIEEERQKEEEKNRLLEEQRKREEQEKEDERLRRYNERRRQQEEEQEKAEEEERHQEPPDDDPNAEVESDPNAEEDPDAEADPNAEVDPNAEEEDPNAESGDDGLP